MKTKNPRCNEDFHQVSSRSYMFRLIYSTDNELSSQSNRSKRRSFGDSLA